MAGLRPFAHGKRTELNRRTTKLNRDPVCKISVTTKMCFPSTNKIDHTTYMGKRMTVKNSRNTDRYHDLNDNTSFNFLPTLNFD